MEGEELEANRRAWVTGEQKRQRQQATGTTVRRVDPHRAEKEQEQTQPMGGEGRSRRGRWRTEEVAARGTSETGDRYAGQQQRWEQHGKGGGSAAERPRLERKNTVQMSPKKGRLRSSSSSEGRPEPPKAERLAPVRVVT